MLFRIAIEIAAVGDLAPNALILKGYKLSRYGAVAFILNGISHQRINKILDPLVPTLKFDIPGVRYISIDSHVDVKTAISSTHLVVACSKEFNDLLECLKPSRFHDSCELRQRFSHSGQRYRLLYGSRPDLGPSAIQLLRSRVSNSAASV